MTAAPHTADECDWLEPAIDSILKTIPANQTIDVRSVTDLVLLLARQGDVAVERECARSAILAACLARKRPVSL